MEHASIVYRQGTIDWRIPLASGRVRGEPQVPPAASREPLPAPEPLPPAPEALPGGLPGILARDQQPYRQGDLLVEPDEARTLLRPTKDPSIGFAFSLNPYRGCGHACAFCFVREYPRAGHGLEDWGEWVSPKPNAPELLWRERHKLRGQKVFLSAGTDPYQPVEARYRLTRQCLEILLQATDAEVHVHTRSPLVLQDLDLLAAFGDRLGVSFSMSTDSEAIRRVAEPRAPSLAARWEALERLAARGIRTGLSVAPLLPVLDPAALGRRAREAGVRIAWVGGLRLLKGDPFRDLLIQRGWLYALKKSYREEVARVILQELDALPRPHRRRTRGPYRAAPIPAALQEPPGLFESAEGVAWEATERRAV